MAENNDAKGIPETYFEHEAHPPAAAMEPGAPLKKSAGCAAQPLPSNAQSPTWDSPASTTPCGAVETDNLFIAAPVAPAIRQQTMVSTVRYGVTPHLEIRWGLPGRIRQSGAGTRPLAGTTDQWLGACLRFHDQGQNTPDLAFDYAIKIPTANPAKGFGSGYVDQLVTLIASRDFGPNHLDFNAVATIAGTSAGHDAASQFGLAFTRTINPRFMATLEAFGGPQPGTPEKYGAVLAGGSLAIRPWLALNGAYSQAFTAGSPHSQIFAGFIYTLRPRTLSSIRP
jgi:hypothetical protein